METLERDFKPSRDLRQAEDRLLNIISFAGLITISLRSSICSFHGHSIHALNFSSFHLKNVAKKSLICFKQGVH